VQLVVSLMPSLLELCGFAAIATTRQSGMKFIDANAVDGSNVQFWHSPATAHHHAAVDRL
jgi:hypothetical protein